MRSQNVVKRTLLVGLLTVLSLFTGSLHAQADVGTIGYYRVWSWPTPDPGNGLCLDSSEYGPRAFPCNLYNPKSVWQTFRIGIERVEANNLHVIFFYNSTTGTCLQTDSNGYIGQSPCRGLASQTFYLRATVGKSYYFDSVAHRTNCISIITTEPAGGGSYKLRWKPCADLPGQYWSMG
ncbi:hypothetical protein ACIA49_18640 [Kribbella sp. NPDC051587]|uniref:hypothetical protein n=1 Tax=Kribbella sp. NPDC051587 TaxID=3364119 RepID=UPI00379FA5EA